MADAFWLLYLAADGKIYGTAGNSVVDIHYINYPDSGGVTCNVQQHALHIPCWNFRTVPNHPNYFLGADVGSPCDTIPLSTNQLSTFNYQLSIYPNPSSTNSQITFTYPSSGGAREIVVNDINGKEMAQYALPQWSTVQHVKLPPLGSGIYIARLVGEGAMGNVKFVVE